MSKRTRKTSPADRPEALDGDSKAGRTLAIVLPSRAPVDGEALASAPPSTLPLLPLRSDVVFPQTVVPLVVNRSAGIRLIDDVLGEDKTLGLVTQRDPDLDEPGLADLYPTSASARSSRCSNSRTARPASSARGWPEPACVAIEQAEPYLIGRVEPLEDVVEGGVELDALVHLVNGLFGRMVDQSQQVPEELQVAAMNTREPGRLADLLGSSLPLPVEEKQELLAELNVRSRLEKLGQFLARQLAVMELSSPRSRRRSARRSPRPSATTSSASRSRRSRRNSARARATTPRSMSSTRSSRRPSSPSPSWPRPAARSSGSRACTPARPNTPSSAPISTGSPPSPGSPPAAIASTSGGARKVLDTDHYDLEKIKERILEYLAVRKLKKDMKGPILCLTGPPGTGKTSLGKSIARALGRQFVRISLGGVHDEAEVRGHRRTYVAAMPGRIIQGIRRAGTNNPVFMLDEVDKLGNDFRGDPSAALLEVLDPEQNAAFRDHYLDVDFDLSKVMFIATANMLETIPAPLLDRMEVLELPGYSEEEKTLIAQRHIIPKQLEAHGLTPENLRFTDGAVRRVIADYTREAGLRNLEREIATICRKVARRHAEGKQGPDRRGGGRGPQGARPPPPLPRGRRPHGTPGVATGLAWTPTGGEILFIEASAVPGKGSLTLTGLLGESMRESAQAALSYLRGHPGLQAPGTAPFGETDIHIHVPAGAVPKDGPSAGVAIAAALMSLFRREAIHQNLAMTGELTLTGRVLPVGGVREKVLAARRAGIKTVLIPRHNQKDLIELPPEVKADVTFHPVDTLDDVVPLPLPAEASPGCPGRPPQGQGEARKPPPEGRSPPRPPSRPRQAQAFAMAGRGLNGGPARAFGRVGDSPRSLPFLARRKAFEIFGVAGAGAGAIPEARGPPPSRRIPPIPEVSSSLFPCETPVGVRPRKPDGRAPGGREHSRVPRTIQRIFITLKFIEDIEWRGSVRLAPPCPGGPRSATLSVGPQDPRTISQRAPPMTTPKSFRWGILGCARISRRGLIPGIRASKTGVVAAIASRDGGTARAWAGEFGIPHAHGSYRDLLEDQDVEAVYIPLPNELHRALGLRGGRRGQARPLRETPVARRGRGRRDGRALPIAWGRPDGGVHVAPPAAASPPSASSSPRGRSATSA